MRKEKRNTMLITMAINRQERRKSTYGHHDVSKGSQTMAAPQQTAPQNQLKGTVMTRSQWAQLTQSKEPTMAIQSKKGSPIHFFHTGLDY